MLGIALVLVLVALGSLKFIGTEFMPTLDEGSLVVTSKRLPGISLDQSIKIGEQIEKTIKSEPGVQSIVTKLGQINFALGLFRKSLTQSVHVLRDAARVIGP